MYGGGGIRFTFYGSGIDVVSVATPENPQSFILVGKPNGDGTTTSEAIAVATWDNSEITYNVTLSGLHSNGETISGFLTLEEQEHEFILTTAATQATFYFDSIIIYK